MVNWSNQHYLYEAFLEQAFGQSYEGAKYINSYKYKCKFPNKSFATVDNYNALNITQKVVVDGYVHFKLSIKLLGL